MAKTIIKNLNKVYPNGYHALHDINLNIEDGEFIVFVGPSGCGKSTLLRTIAGLEDISSGELYMDDKLLNNVDPKDRDVAMVFQDYALYPHMSVKENLEFSLKIRKYDKKVINEKVNKAAQILEIKDLLKRKPKALSGGQRQRVALGRAIVRDPKLFLFDEPLSNLDAKLRSSMRVEIIKLHQEMKKHNTSFIYVTHDQIEAMTMADRIVVLRDGYIQQIGSPEQIYDDPKNLFVASFIGQPSINFLDTEIVDKNLIIKGTNYICIKDYKGPENVLIGIRPDQIKLGGPIEMMVSFTELLGSEKCVYGKIADNKIVAKLEGKHRVNTNEVMNIDFNKQSLYYFNKENEERIYFD